MNLRIRLALTNFREVDVSVANDISPSALLQVVNQIARTSHGPHDLVGIQVMEEIPAPEPSSPATPVAAALPNYAHRSLNTEMDLL